MRTRVVAVALAVMVAFAGCSAIEINRPADTATPTDASGGPAAPTDEVTGVAGGDGANGDGPSGTDGSGDESGATDARATAEPTATPSADAVRLVNEGEDDRVVDVTVTGGPIEAVELDRADGSTDVVVLEDRSVDEVLTFDTVDVRPVEVVEATAVFEVDGGESVDGTLPGEDRRRVLVEVSVDDDEEPTVVGAAVLTCPAGESVGDATVTVDGEETDVSGECIG